MEKELIHIMGDLFYGVELSKKKENKSNIEVDVICHVCNDVGAWGSGFVISLSNKYKKPEEVYKKAYLNEKMELGCNQVIKIENNLFVINMIAQKGIRNMTGEPLINYTALDACLKNISNFYKSQLINPIFHMPRIGCGLAGGSWNVVEHLLVERLLHSYPINIYTPLNDTHKFPKCEYKILGSK